MPTYASSSTGAAFRNFNASAAASFAFPYLPMYRFTLASNALTAAPLKYFCTSLPTTFGVFTAFSTSRKIHSYVAFTELRDTLARNSIGFSSTITRPPCSSLSVP